jgi:hypothetical protein
MGGRTKKKKKVLYKAGRLAIADRNHNPHTHTNNTQLDIGGKNYFAFFDWSTFPNGTVVSHCATTQMGWYRENTAVAPPSTLGCMSASRADARAEDLRRSYTISPEVLARTGRGPSVALRALRPRPPPIARPLPSSRLASERGGVRSRRAGRQLSESDFPASFSWTNIGGKSYVGPIRDQLNCGRYVTVHIRGLGLFLAIFIFNSPTLFQKKKKKKKNHAQLLRLWLDQCAERDGARPHADAL